MSRGKWWLKLVLKLVLLFFMSVTAFGLYMDPRGATAWPWMTFWTVVVAVIFLVGDGRKAPSASSSGSAPHQ